MIISHHGIAESSFSKIAKSGLVLWLDAMNDNSYSGSGTNWYNLATQSPISASLTNGPTFQSASAVFLPRSSWTSGTGTSNSATFSSSIDNNISTRWTTGTLMSIGSTYAVDFGKTVRLTSFFMNAGSSTGDYPATFAISSSTDNSTWTVVGTTSGSAAKVYTFSPEIDARYLTFRVTSTNNAWWSIHEFTAFGAITPDGGSISLDGSNDYVTTGENFNTDPIIGGFLASASLAWSVSSWFRPDTSNATAGTVFCKAGGTGTSATMIVWEAGTTLNTRLRGGTTLAITTSMTTDWHEVVLTWDGTTAKAYYDGIFVSNISVGSAAVQTSVLSLGAASVPTAPNTYMLGRVADLKVYNRALSATEVTQNYYAVRRRFGL